MAKILIVEDDMELAGLVSQHLSTELHDVQHADDGAEGFSRLKNYSYDLVILDWNLPRMTGVSICKEVRASGQYIPILMLTAKSAVDDKEESFDAGADDYLTKPFNMRELSARVRALLRRPKHMTESVLRICDVELDAKARKVTKAGQTIHLRPQEFNLLEFLLRNQGEVFSAEAILERVWHSDSDATKDTVRTHINRIRTKIEAKDDAPMLHTFYGIGYKLEAPQ